MKAPCSEALLGAWMVTESVFGPDGSLLGTVHQKRTLQTQASTGIILVGQHCQPCRQLQDHAMAAFSGDFQFSLKTQGRQRHYLGPDVHGLGTSFADGFVCGHGVWPRFGYNFRSWSISLSGSAQLTGGCFYRGQSPVAVMIGVGTEVRDDHWPQALTTSFALQSAQGQSTILDLSRDEEQSTEITREILDAGHWVEYGIGREDVFHLEAHDTDFVLHKNQRAVGMAKSYGPLLYWETHGHHGDVSSGIEVMGPSGLQWFSLRQHVQNGRLASLEGLRFTI